MEVNYIQDYKLDRKYEWRVGEKKETKSFPDNII